MASKPTEDPVLTKLNDHYFKGVQDMTIRRTRKNGWNDIVNAYMQRIPPNWPYQSVVFEPLIRSTILEKTSRLLNSKLQGRLVPREGGDVIGARINNAILDFQWDAANNGGSMVEKVAVCDQTARLTGAAFAWIYWDKKKSSNEMKPIDPRDIFPDPAATHIRNAAWVQVREFTKLQKLVERFPSIKPYVGDLQNGVVATSDKRSSSYEDQVKVNRGLIDRIGQDPWDPTIELVTEFNVLDNKFYYYLPRYHRLLDTETNPYKHGKIPIAMLRYYPLGDDIYGESEVDAVLPLARAVNSILSGFIDEMNITMRPPVKVVSGQVRKETLQYGPGAVWVMNTPNAVEQMQFSGQTIANFNSTYPMLKAAFNTAMGDQSLGVSNIGPQYGGQKTAHEVVSLEQQQNNRDQYNQLYLSQFLEDIMSMWLENNRQYLFDDPTKKYQIFKIIGKDNIQALQQYQLGDNDIPDEAMEELMKTIIAAPGAITGGMLEGITKDLSVPKNPVKIGGSDLNPKVKSKLDVNETGDEADLYVEPEDMEGIYDYVPDVKSMAAGAGVMMQNARNQMLQDLMNPAVLQLLQTQGEMLKIKELLVNRLEDVGYKDAESLFQPLQPTQPGSVPPGPMGNPGTGGPAGGIVGGPEAGPQAGGMPSAIGGVGGIPGVPSAVPNGAGQPGMAGAQGLPV